MGQICGDGPCLDCDVCADGCDHDSVQAAINAAAQGATVAICPGTYENGKGRIVLGSEDPDKVVTLIGAGDGDEPEFDTILKNTDVDNSVVLNNATLTLKRLRITGGKAIVSGGGISNYGTVRVVGCTIVENLATNGAGIYNDDSLEMIESTVRDNDAEYGGGISTGVGSTSTLSNCDITGNTATQSGGGIYCSGAVTFQEPLNRVTGNSAGDRGSGILVDGEGEGIGLFGVTFVEISGNTPASDQCFGQGCPT